MMNTTETLDECRDWVSILQTESNPVSKIMRMDHGQNHNIATLRKLQYSISLDCEMPSSIGQVS